MIDEDFLSQFPSMDEHSELGYLFPRQESDERQNLQLESKGFNRIIRLVLQGGPRPKFLTKEENQYLNDLIKPKRDGPKFEQVPIYRIRFIKPPKINIFYRVEVPTELSIEYDFFEGTREECIAHHGYEPKRYDQIGYKLVEVTD